MAYSIVDVKADMVGALHGTQLNQITGLNYLFNRAARDIMADCNPMETVRFSEPIPLHTGVYDYACPDDLKGTDIIDIRPQVKRFPNDGVFQTFSQNFDRIKARILQGAAVNVQWNTYVRSLNIAVDKQPVISINSCSSLTGNGTWAVVGGASDLTIDNQNNVNGTGSLKFELASDGGVECTGLSPIDLTELDPEGSFYLWFWLPLGTMTNMKLRWGSDASNYFEQTATQTQSNTAFQTGWNLLAFPWETATQTGTPDSSNITYLRVYFDTPDAKNPIRIDSITASLGSMYSIVYYSKCLFRDFTTGAFKEKVTDDTDLLNLDTDSYQIFFNKVMVLTCQQKQGVDALAADLPYFQAEYLKSVRDYQFKYPSQVQKTQVAYYSPLIRSYDNYLGRPRI